MKYDAIVVGCGGIGSSALYHLAKAGQSVLGLDRFYPPHDRGSSHGSTRIIRQAYFENARYIPLLKRAYELWEGLEARTGKHLFHRVGLLILSGERGGIADAAQKNAAEYGVPIKMLSSALVRERYPAFEIPDNYTGTLEPGAGYLEVENCVGAHLDLARSLGAETRFGESFAHWEKTAGGVICTTDKGRYEAKYLVLSSGAWSPGLLVETGMSLVVRRAPQFWYRGDASFEESRGMPCFAFARGKDFIYGFPSVPELGVKVASYAASEIVEDPLHVSPVATAEEKKTVESYIREFLPGLQMPASREKLCLYTLTQDENFLVDWHPKSDRVFVTTGGSGHAFKFVSVLGEIVAQKLLGQTLPWNLDFLAFR